MPSNVPASPATHRRRVFSGLLVTMALVAVAIAHAPFARTRLRDVAVERLRADAGIDARIERLDYNLLTLRVSVGPTVLAADGERQPFLTLEGLEIDLPWSVVFGRLAVESITLHRPVLTVIRDAQGHLNLPDAAADDAEPAAGSDPIHIGALTVRDLGIAYRDDESGLTVDGGSVTLDMTRRRADGLLAGRLEMSGGARITAEAGETVVSHFAGDVTFDGRAVAVDGLTLEAPEGRLRLSGTMDVLAADSPVRARYAGLLVLPRLVPWFAPGESVAGEVALSGAVTGTAGAPAATLEVTAGQVAWRNFRKISVTLGASLSTSDAVIDRLRIGVDDGVVNGRARFHLTGDAASEADVRWTGLDVGALLTAAGMSEPRLATSGSGHATATWRGTGIDGATASLDVLLTSRPAAAGALSVSGRLGATLARGEWQATLDGADTRHLAIRGRAGGRVNAADLMTTTLAGEMRAEADNLPALLAELTAAGLVPEDAAPLTGGRASVALTLGGTFGAPSATGRLHAPALALAGVEGGALSARLAAERQRLAVEEFAVSLPPNSARGRLVADLERHTLRGRVTADVPQLSTLTGWLPPESRLDGTLTLAADIGGTLDVPEARVVLGADRLAVAGQRIDRADLEARLEGRLLVVDRFDARQGAGHLRATGRYELGSGQYRVAAAGRDLIVRPVVTSGEPLPISARLDLDFEGHGSVTDPAGRGSLSVRELAWGDYLVGSLGAATTVEAHRLTLTATVPAVAATLELSASLAASGTFEARVAVDGASLEALSRPTGPGGVPPAPESAPGAGALRGTVTATATASGPLERPADATVAVALHLADAMVGPAPVQLDRSAALRYEAGQLTVDELTLRTGGTSVTARGSVGTPGTAEALTIAVDGALDDLVPFARLVEGLESLNAAGRVDARLTVAGAFDAPDLDAAFTLTDASVTWPDLPPVTDVRMHATFADGLLSLRDAAAAWQGAALRATGAFPAVLLGDRLPAGYLATLPPLPERASATLRIEGVTEAAAAPFVDPATLKLVEAAAAATVTIDATALAMAGLDARVVVDRAEVSVAGQSLQQERPTRLSVAGGRLEVVDWSWRGGGNALSVTGGATLTGDRPEVQAAVGGSLDLRLLGVASPEVALGGRAVFDVTAAGPLDDPAIDGTITLRDGEIAMREPRLAVSDLTGAVVIAGNRVRVTDVRAAANGGTMTLAGEIRLDAFAPAGGTLRLEGRGLAVEMPEDLRSEVDLDLTLDADPDAPTVGGTITILRGAYTQPVSLAGQLMASTALAPVAAEPGVLDRLRFDIDVVSKDGIIVDNNYGSLELDSNLEVGGTFLLPVVAGRMTVTEGGAVFLAGQTWAIERGTIDFTSATRLEPNVDLSLVTRLQQYEIRLAVSGTQDTLEATLSSPDGISQADAVSLLLTGQLADRQTVSQSAVARGQLLLLLSGELLGFAGRAVGLDSAQVGRGLGSAASSFDLLATDSDPSTRLTVSKQLRRDVELVLSRSLRDSNDLTWIAIYRPRRALELRATTLDDNGRSYEFRGERNFGGGASAGRRDLRPAPRVSAVRFDGAAAADEPALRARLRLDEGDRFDFYRWQQDRDRLAEWYQGRGFLEARIRASRASVASAAGEAAGVELTYAIDQGPATSILVSGPALPGSLQTDIRTAWASALSDSFLREDVAALAVRALAADGHLEATADVRIETNEAAGTKQLQVTATPGPRYAERRITIRGEQAVSAGDLLEVIDANRLTLTAWLRPSEVEDVLAAHYRALGHLQAAVEVEPPVFAGRAATLPVTVREGPQFDVDGVMLEGVSAARRDTVLEVFGITSGEPYHPASLDAARRRVEIDYLDAGYNDVRVTVAAAAAGASSVGVTVRVDEGAQQVLSAIEIAGTASTTRGTVDTALALTPGEPVTRSDTFRAQKRLYDTGIFRRADVELRPDGEAADDGTQPVTAVVTLDEVPPYRLRYGVRLIDDLGPLEGRREIRPGLVVDGLRRNLFGRALSAGVAGQLERDRRLARGIITTPQLFGLPVTTNLFLTQSRQEFAAPDIRPFVRDASEIVAEQRFNPRDNLTVAYNYRFLRTHAFETGRAPGDPGFDLRVDVARLSGTVARDTRDDPFDSRRGWFLSSGVEFATPSLGSDLRFLKFIAQQFYFRTVAGRVVLASAARLGTAWGYEAPLLFSERYFAGGGTSVRGYAENGLGAADVFGDPVGGAASLVFNQEVRFPLHKWVHGVAFVDAGNVFPRLRDLSPGNLAYGAGLGLRVTTPFGLARVDYGLPLTGRRAQPFGRWYVSLGQAF